MKTKLVTTVLLTLAMNTFSNNAFTEKVNNKLVGKITPGIQYARSNPDGTIQSYHFGLSDIEKNNPVDEKTVFKAFSATKVITAIAILQLYEKGLLKLDKHIQTYLLQYNFTKNITIRQALTHSAGLSSNPMVSEIHLESEHNDFVFDKWDESYIRANLEIKETSGKKKKYSNFGYLILGEIISKVSGMEYQAYVEKYIIDKLPLAGNYMGFNNSNNAAMGYLKRHTIWSLMYHFIVDKKFWGKKTRKWTEVNPMYLNGPSYGGLSCNSQALLILGMELIKDNSALLNNKTSKLLFTPQKNIDGKPLKHSLGLWQRTENVETYFFHPGGGGGYSCELRIYPDSNKVCVLMMNKTQTFSDFKIISKLEKHFQK